MSSKHRPQRSTLLARIEHVSWHCDRWSLFFTAIVIPSTAEAFLWSIDMTWTMKLFHVSDHADSRFAKGVCVYLAQDVANEICTFKRKIYEFRRGFRFTGQPLMCIRRSCNPPPSQQKTKFQGIARNVGQLLSILETEAAMNHRLSTSWLENQCLTGFKKHGALRDIICTSIQININTNIDIDININIEINRYDIHMSDLHTFLYFVSQKGENRRKYVNSNFCQGQEPLDDTPACFFVSSFW